MTHNPSPYFERIKSRIDVALLSQKLVVVVGVGTVGSQIVRELANSGVGRLRLIDGDRLDNENLVRHVLSQEYVGRFKTHGLTQYLADVPGLHVDPVPSYVDGDMSDRDMDALLHDADLIVAATDNRQAQRRIGRRALSLDIPALFPALYADGGGEVFVQRSPRLPCFLCWDAFRPADAQLREVTALNAEALSIIEYSVHLCHGVLDRRSTFARSLAPEHQGEAVPQLFVQRPFGPFAAKPIPRRPDCPSCAVGPAIEVLRATPAPGVASVTPSLPAGEPLVLQSSEPTSDEVDVGYAGAKGAFWGLIASAVPCAISLALFHETAVGAIFFLASFFGTIFGGAKLAIWVARKHPDWS